MEFGMEPMDSGEPGTVCEGLWQLLREGRHGPAGSGREHGDHSHGHTRGVAHMAEELVKMPPAPRVFSRCPPHKSTAVTALGSPHLYLASCYPLTSPTKSKALGCPVGLLPFPTKLLTFHVCPSLTWGMNSMCHLHRVHILILNLPEAATSKPAQMPRRARTAAVEK